MDIDFNTGMVYMVLSYFSGVDKHYIIATTNLAQVNFDYSESLPIKIGFQIFSSDLM